MTTMYIVENDEPIEDGNRHWQQIPADRVDDYTEIGMRSQMDVVVDVSQSASTSTNIHICVLEEDSDGNHYPSKRHAPGY